MVPMSVKEYDVVAVGGGTGGLVTAAGAAYLGARPALIERAALGGDCLWTGCVPSKALLASARRAHGMRHAEEVGVAASSAPLSFRSVMERMRHARATVAHHDDPERFRKMGVGVHFGAASFTGPGTLEVEGVGTVRSKRIVIATGAEPFVPPLPGLQEAGYLTHESAFQMDELPPSLVILGGGPVGLEFAQVYARLGARVTVLEAAPRILSAEDPDASAVLREALEEEGIRVLTGATAVRVELAAPGGEAGKVVVTDEGDTHRAHELFVATGRRPRSEGLELERGGVDTDGTAVRVDDALRTSASGVWAVGDVTGGPQFTHAADYMAKTALRNCLLPFSSRVDLDSVPRVTYTDPEVAHVGLGEAEARDRGGRIFHYELADLDRAIVDAATRGFVKVSADRKGRILGATIVASGAGELLQPLILARRHGLGLSDVAGTIFPYPTMVEGVKRAADAYQRTRLEGVGGILLKKLVSWLT